MNTQELVQWLLESGGPTIRYRTAKELAEINSGIDLGKMAIELSDSQEVKAWLDNLDPNKVNPLTYHGCANTCFENAMGKLAQLGIHAGMAPLDKRTQLLREWLERMFNASEEKWDVFAMTIFASFLAVAGYEDNAIKSFLDIRLEVLYEFMSKRNYDIYDDTGKYKGVPRAFQGRPIINPSLYVGGNYKYPLIYDVYGLSTMVNKGDMAVDDKINTIIKYIMSPEYHQKIVDGYGILAAPNGKYYSMGWDVKVPGFFGIGVEVGKKGALLIQRMELMAHFPCVAGTAWFTSALDHLETFKTDKGTYNFPKHYLGEKEGYWVCGMHMGLGENRRAKIANELESTFWMMLIKKLAGMI